MVTKNVSAMSFKVAANVMQPCDGGEIQDQCQKVQSNN